MAYSYRSFLGKRLTPSFGGNPAPAPTSQYISTSYRYRKKNKSLGRERAIEAALELFYKGEIAQEIVSFVQGGGGFLSMSDMEEFEVGHEPPEIGRFNEFEVYTNGPWSQGPVFAETIQLLAGDDLKGLGHNSADYIHLLAEALKISFSDRDAFYGDPDFIDVPIRGLLNEAYAKSRRADIDIS